MALMGELGALSERMDEEEAWALEQQCQEVLQRLGITDLHRPVEDLSGGYRKRVGLASTGRCRSVIPRRCNTSWHCCSSAQASSSSMRSLSAPSSPIRAVSSGDWATASETSLKRSSRSLFAPHPAKTCSSTVSPGFT